MKINTGKKFKVMIFPCGAENALEINDALKYHIDVEVWGASSIEDHGIFAYPNYIGGVPYISASNFFEEFNRVIKQHHINFIIPTHDTVALFFAQNSYKINANIVTSNADTALLCRNKRMTYELFKNEPFCPVTYSDSIAVNNYPVFIKPNIGEGGKNTAIANSKAELEHLLLNYDDLLIVEYLPGDELTVDCFTNSKGQLLFVGPRTRQRIKMGISFHSESVELTTAIKEIANTINTKVKFKGLWFFQLKKDINGVFKLLEISTRCAGTMALYRQRGINFPLLSVMDAAGVEVSVLDNGNNIVLDRCIKTRYRQSINYEYVYLDFDDTVIINNQVNLNVMTFVYQCLNEGKKVILITRHEKEIFDTLQKYNISSSLFNSIITLNWEQHKSDKINNLNSIFIDNSFAERMKVKREKNIPVFDVDAIDGLLHY